MPNPPSSAQDAASHNDPIALRDWHAITIIGVAVALFFREIVLAKSFFWEDFLRQAYPFRTLAAVSLSQGELPLWNPYTFGGMPLQADIQSAIFYIPNLLLTPFVQNERLSFYAFEMFLVAHYWIAGITMYYLAREFGLQRAYALFSGLLFALSGFMIVQAIHPAFVQQLAWFPLAFLMFHRTMVRRSLASALIAGLVIGLSMLAGAPQMTLYLIFLLGLYWLFVLAGAVRRSGVADNRHMFVLPAVAMAVALGTAAIQLLPTIELRPYSERATLTLEQAQYGKLGWQQFITALVPKMFGWESANVHSYWGPGPYGSFWEACFYVGIAGLLTTLYSVTLIREHRLIFFLFAVSALAFLLALGDQFFLHRLFFEYVPGFGAFRGAGRITVLATFSAALLGAFGLRAFVERANIQPRRAEVALAWAAGAALLVWLLLRTRLLLPIADRLYETEIFRASLRETTMALALTFGICALGVLLTRRIARAAVVLPLLLATQFVDMNLFGFDQNNSPESDVDYFDRTTPDVVRILKEEGKREIFRVASRRDTLLFLGRNHSMVARFFLLDGYTPLKLRRTLPAARNLEAAYDLMNVKYRPQVIDSLGTVALRYTNTYLPRAFFVHRAALLTEERRIDSLMSLPRFNPREEVVVERTIDLPPTRPQPSVVTSASITSYRMNEIRFDLATPSDALLVMSEIWYPGWKARVDGEETTLYRANGILRAVAIPSGKHQMVMSFEPRSFFLGAMVTGLTLLMALVVLVFISPLRRRARPG